MFRSDKGRRGCRILKPVEMAAVESFISPVCCAREGLDDGFRNRFPVGGRQGLKMGNCGVDVKIVTDRRRTIDGIATGKRKGEARGRGSELSMLVLLEFGLLDACQVVVDGIGPAVRARCES